MRKLERYDLKSTFDIEGKYILYQGINSKTNEAVIVKTVNYNQASIIDKAQLHHEFELLLRLSDLSPHVLQPVDYIDSNEGIGLAFHDHGAKSLNEWFDILLRATPYSIELIYLALFSILHKYHFVERCRTFHLQKIH